MKGLSWDPIGKFLVTQAADKSLRIWRTDNWRCVKVIKEPFVEVNQEVSYIIDCLVDKLWYIYNIIMHGGFIFTITSSGVYFYEINSILFFFHSCENYLE